MLKCRRAVKTLFTIVLAWLAASTQAGFAQTTGSYPPLRAAQLTGLKVEDTDGRKIGTLRNLILDMRTGQIKYAVIGTAGFVGIRSTLRLAPAQIMSAATTKRETLSIDTTWDQWKSAPTFKSSQLPLLAQPGQAEQIARYFAKSDFRIASSSGAPLPATDTGTDAQTNNPPDTLRLASDLIGKSVVNHQRQKIGEVIDLLVRFSRTHTTFAIVSTGKLFWRGREYAIPVTALSPAESGSRLLIDVDTATLQKASPFNQQVWDAADLVKSTIFTYSRADQ
jgi:sporulation protein YlmC with PRC-barrel domain